MTAPPLAASQRRQARIAGALYLAVIAGGLFAQAGAIEPLVRPGDPAATAGAIAAREGLWRLGLAVHLLYLVCAVPLACILYDLFRPVQATLARAALAFALVSLTVEAGVLLQLYTPLVAAGGAGLDEAQRQALGYLAIRLYSVGFGFALLFFAGFCVLAGLLILRSGLVPRTIGALMLLAGGCYAVDTLALILAPAWAAALFPWILVPCLVAEASLALWLLTKGVERPAASVRPARA